MASTRFYKRLFDVAGAGAGVLVFLPAMVLIASAITLEDGGPVLFRQQSPWPRMARFARIAAGNLVWHVCWYNAGMGERKITVHVPADLLDKAQKSSGHGITETVRQGLRLVAAGDTYRRLAALRGSVKFSIDLARLREDRG